MLRFLIITTSVLLMSCGNYNKVKRPFSLQGSGEIIKGAQIDFAEIKSKILKPHCISCHTGRHDQYEQYTSVKAFNPQSLLDRMLTSDPVKKMPKDAPPLNDDLINLFKTWVANGSPEFANEEPKAEPSTEKTLSFLDIKQQVLAPNRCTSCHSQFNDYASVQRSLGSIVNLTLSNAMPFPSRKNLPATPVSDAGKDLLMKWVSQGAPEFSDRPAAPALKEELKPNWISLRNNVFGPKCILCHNSYGPRGPKSLASYRDIWDYFKKTPLLFNFESPNDSHFIGAIIGRFDDDEAFFSKMPFNNKFDDVQGVIPDVTEYELNVIKKWIELKLPYDEDER